MSDQKIPEEFLKLFKNVNNKRAKFLIDTILEKGFCTTEDLKNAGYEHAPRAARDVKELNIPLDSIRTKDSDGKSIAKYVFGNFNDVKKKSLIAKGSGRTQLTSKLKDALIVKYGAKCHLYGEEFSKQSLQVDHRIPFEIGGDPADILDISNFMLVCPSANREKSWSCEHCSNWKMKDVGFCKTCYYAFPEKYAHIADKEEYRISVNFGKNEISLYDALLKGAEKEHTSNSDFIKRLLAYSLKIKF